MAETVRFHGCGDIRVEHMEEPRCGRGEVKVSRPLPFSNIAGVPMLTRGHLHEYLSGPVLIPKREHPITKEKPPVTMGHEFSGLIETVGDDVKGFARGQRAVVRPTIFDGQCMACRQGYRHCCKNIGFIGLSGYGGGMAQYIVAPAGHYYLIPDNVSLETAALVEPLAVAWHAVNRSPFKLGDSALVLGGGPVGIGVIQVLKLQGAKQIIVVELMERRKKLGEYYGATHTYDPREVNIPEEVHKITENKGADVIFDTAGVENALNGVIPACRVHGTIVNIAVWENKPALNVNVITYKEINYMGAALYDEVSFKNVIEALSHGQLNPERMITAKIKLSEAVDKGFQELIDHRDQHCKLLIDVQRT
ncbi:alcohol dehydrogenase [Penicillium capsulatum]|uniref:Alcohol dehydrogenase n=1 Tax=Penicillium capsulatum TaxID=69766 RepID=A0A9W9LVP1_9EURO|nr:alcohol dehydrogenase [Penicillium capsulatum]KAJ6123331.1 alcohol dehydrogenase [Penicillium capsulatum]